MFLRYLNNVWRSATFRLGIGFIGLFSLSFFIVGSLIYWQSGRLMEREYRGQIDGEITEMRSFYDQFGPDRVASEIIEREQQDPFWTSFLLDKQCNPISGNSRWLNTIERRTAMGQLSGNRIRGFCNSADEEGWLQFEVLGDFPAGTTGSAYDDDIYGRLVPLSDQHQIIVGRMAGNLEDLRNVILDALSWGLAVTIGFALGGSLIMARSVNNRLEVINRVSRGIQRGDLSHRVPLMQSGDEFDRLSKNLNEMLDQIEKLMMGVRNVSNAIAHDLRTPLTRLRTNLEQLRDDAVSDETRNKVESTIKEADALLSTFRSLLRIAEIESGNRRTNFHEVRLENLINDVSELYEPLTGEKGLDMTTEISTSASVSGDRDLLFQAISNVVDNAIKYTPEDGHIKILLKRTPEGALVEITDSGDGIPEAYRKQVFERFYRLESHRKSVGSGLGLSLVAAIVTLHGGLITLADAHPGLCVQIKLPRS